MNGLPSTRKEAIEKGATQYFTGRSCGHGHVAPRFVSNKGCAECLKAGSKKYYWANHEGQLERRKKYCALNADKISADNMAWRAGNQKHLSAYAEKHKQHKQERQKAHYREHPEGYTARGAHRRARKLQATPKWADKEKINEMYRRRAEVSQATGVVHHVDHIIPLRGRTVCGLHVEQNLQILPAEENLAKGNALLSAYAEGGV